MAAYHLGVLAYGHTYSTCKCSIAIINIGYTCFYPALTVTTKYLDWILSVKVYSVMSGPEVTISFLPGAF